MVAERRQFEVWGRMTAAEKFAAFARLMELADAVAEAGIGLRHPGADERERFLRLAARRLDAATMRLTASTPRITAAGWGR